MEQLLNYVQYVAQENPEGFTIHLGEKRFATKGFVVAYKDTQHSHSAKDLPKVIQHALDHDGFVGGWLDTEEGLYYYDSCMVVQSLPEAMALGKHEEQKAIYNLTNGAEIFI